MTLCKQSLRLELRLEKGAPGKPHKAPSSQFPFDVLSFTVPAGCPGQPETCSLEALPQQTEPKRVLSACRGTDAAVTLASLSDFMNSGARHGWPQTLSVRSHDQPRVVWESGLSRGRGGICFLYGRLQLD